MSCTIGKQGLSQTSLPQVQFGKMENGSVNHCGLSTSRLETSQQRLLIITLLVLSIIPMGLADHCDDNAVICQRSCRGGDPRSAGACLAGCGLAHIICKIFFR